MCLTISPPHHTHICKHAYAHTRTPTCRICRGEIKKKGRIEERTVTGLPGSSQGFLKYVMLAFVVMNWINHFCLSQRGNTSPRLQLVQTFLGLCNSQGSWGCSSVVASVWQMCTCTYTHKSLGSVSSTMEYQYP